ncbi:MAG TPA: 3-deoxy-D-manno-octulosonic acid transferase [Phycisphaerae bacterium]|nr:3-deoxy-D-manno-octulosonic acid transferase [Phycisphaerae bacterium]
MRWLANLVYLIGAAFYLPVLCYQMLVQRKNRRGWRQRFGHWPIRPSDKRRIWIHAVSLGEINATPLLVRKLEQRLPDADIVISTTTDTGYARACKLYGADRVFRFPLDFSWVVARVLRRVQPSLIVLVELEVWYNLVRTASGRGIPIAVVNGRLTDRSRKRFGLIAPLARAMFRRLTWVGAQDERIATRFRELGTLTDRVEVIGSVKWDTTTVADTIDGANDLAATLGIEPDVPLWVCGSTGPAEEAIILDAYARLLEAGVSLTLAVIPRKPERFDEVADLIRSRGHTCIRRSERPDAPPTNAPVPPGHPETVPPSVDPGHAPARTAPRPVFLGDTMGELRKFYSLASVVFVGRSLVPMGGSDPMEVAALARPIIVGPHMDNFAAPVEAFAAVDAIRVADNVRTLATAVGDLIADQKAARQQGIRARKVVLDNQGATDRTADRLVGLLTRK